MATETKTPACAKRLFKPKPPVPAVELQPMYGCQVSRGETFITLKGFPAVQLEGTITNKFQTSGDKPRFTLAVDISDQACEALKTSLKNSIAPHFLTLSVPTVRDEEAAKSLKKMKVEAPAVKIPVNEIDKAAFETDRIYWGVNVDMTSKTTFLKVDDGSFVPATFQELRIGDEVQIHVFVSLYDYFNGKLQRKSGISLIANRVIYERGIQNTQVEEEGEVPEAFVIHWKGQTYTI
jgi:hypothetical protein